MRGKIGLLVLLSVGISQGDPNETDEKEPVPQAEEEAGKADGENENKAPRMNNEKLGQIIRRIDPNAAGGDGVWQFQLNDVPLICMTDEFADRMRIISPILEMEKVTPEQLAKCMEANFDKALDARYCVFRETLWSAFIHPLGDLSPELFESAVGQVVITHLTFGTTYNSGALKFGDEEDEDVEPEPEPLSPLETA
ncbi:MAG: hypothetical protein AAGA58_18885 [Verrucomicrobiota bacterium]